jgi:hypothetical protein
MKAQVFGIRCTAATQLAVGAGVRAAMGCGHWEVDTHHLLVGLSAPAGSFVSDLPGLMGITRGEIRVAVLALYPLGPGRLLSGALPWTTAARESVIYANQLAGQLGTAEFGRAHLLAGLLSTPRGAVRVVERLGLNAALVRQLAEQAALQGV